MSALSLIDLEQECLVHMRANGIPFEGPLKSDGKPHRFSIDAKQNQPDEWYVCYAGTTQRGAPYLTCMYGTWSGGQEKFIYRSYETQRALSDNERSHLRANEEKRSRDLELKLKVEKEEGTRRANKKWEEAAEKATLPGHLTYLNQKQVEAFGIRYRVENDGTVVIVVPLRNIEGELQAIQSIHEDGTKRIYGAKKGNFHLIGSLEETFSAYITEGYATGASIHQALKVPVVVAFDCGNLKAVASNLRKKYPQLTFIIAGDNDVETRGNPGRTKAEEAGQDTGCAVVFPKFPDGFKLSDEKVPTDFNDLYVNFGEGEVINQLKDLSSLVQTSESAPQGKFQFRSAHSLIQAPPAANWLIKGYLDLGSLGVLFGEPGSMKSFFAIDMGFSIATGRDWHGIPVRKTGPVFYIAGEGFSGLSKRLRAWATANHISLEETPFFVSDRPAQLLDLPRALEVTAAIDELAKQHGEPVFVVIDTLNRNFGPGDENKTEDMSKFVACIDSAIRLKYRCSVLIVHHTPLNDPGRGRGSTALRGAADWEYCLSKKGERTRKLSATKVKDYEEPPDLYFQPKSVTLDGWVDKEDGELMTSCILEVVDDDESSFKYSETLTDPQKKALSCLLELESPSKDPRGVPMDEWRQAAYSAGISTSKELGTKRKAFKRATDQLVKLGFVSIDNDYCKLRDKGQGQDNEGHVPFKFKTGGGQTGHFL